MKKQFLALVLILFSCNIIAQDYFKFPTSNAIWNHIVTQSMSPPTEWTVIDSLGEQIIIDSLTYIELYRDDYIIGAIREDTSSRKVFFHNYYSEIVLYDFNLNIDDTIFYSTNLFYNIDYYKVVEFIDSVDVSGQFRKRWFLNNSELDLIDIWIEGIGSIHRYGLLYPNDPAIVLDGSIPYFGCFKHDSITYFDENSCTGICPCSNWLVGIISNSEKDKTTFSIFPIPFDDYLTIYFENNNHTFSFIEILTIDNRLIEKRRINNNQIIKINTSQFKSGLYFIKMIDNNNCYLHKVIKK